VIVISGDDAYFDCADRIVMLFEGTLAVADAPAVRSRFQAEPESSERDSYA
jgi:ABC-type siderophore export system fused ATPase/permease subunit